MSIAVVPDSPSTQTLPPGDLHDELRHIRDLVFVRDLLRAHGAAPSELEEYAAVIEAARGRLAESAKRASARYAA
jgi:hypothetical protein